jgi:hypothetical protein
MKSDDEDGLRKCFREPVVAVNRCRFLKCPALLNWQLKVLSRLCPVETVKIVEAAFILQQTRVAPRDYSRPS